VVEIIVGIGTRKFN